jgi:hypothetical protein
MYSFKKFTGLFLLILGVLTLFIFMYALSNFEEQLLDIPEKTQNVSREERTSFELYKNAIIQSVYIPTTLKCFVSSSLAIIGSILLIGINGEKKK